MTKTATITFDLTTAEILNSNSMPTHFIQKGKAVARLRSKAASEVLLLHPPSVRADLISHLDQLEREKNRMIMRKRLKKRLSANLTKDEVEKALEEEFPTLALVDYGIKPLFDKFTIRVFVLPPTRRRLDPPNLWPTVKALTDGATDALCWVDDDSSHLLETSFRYGGLSGDKNWRISLVVTEVEDTSGFQIETEIAEDDIRQ